MGDHDTHIRRVGRDDWRALRDLRLEALREAPDAFVTRHEQALEYTDDEWRDRTTWPTFVADDGADLVGMATCMRRNDTTAVLTQMYVRPDRRGSDVAARLVDAVVSHARAEGAVRVELGVKDGNGRAERLYAKCGFARTGEIRHIEGFGNDIRMALDL